jgi:hypothetical protein
MKLSRFLHFVLRTYFKSRLEATELIALVVMMSIYSYKPDILELTDAQYALQYTTFSGADARYALQYTTYNTNYFTYISSNIAIISFQMKFAHLNALYGYILTHRQYVRELCPSS